MPAHDEAAAPAQQRQHLRGHWAGFDVRVVDDRPDRPAAFPRGGDLVDLGLDLLLDDGEGEIAHLVTAGPHGRAIPFIEVFGELGLRQAGATAIAVDRLLATAAGPGAKAATTRRALGQAINGVLAAVVALADPELIIIGGSWGSHPVILDIISAATARLPRHTLIRAARLTTEPSLAGARLEAVDRLRSAIVTTAHRGQAEHR